MEVLSGFIVNSSVGSICETRGISVAYYKQGVFCSSKQKVLCSYVDGKLHGTARCWHKNGRLRQEVSYINGIADGAWKTWFSNGKLSFEMKILNGKVHGKVHICNRNGKCTWNKSCD